MEDDKYWDDFYDWYFNDYLKALEKKYCTKLGQREAFLVFDKEFEEIYNEKNKEINSMNKIKNKLYSTIDNEIFELNRIKALKDELDFLFDIFWHDVKHMEMQMNRAKRVYEGVKKRGKADLYALPVEEAKQVPIENLFEPEKEKRSARRIKCCCPFPDHNDDSPSLEINTNKNTFRCYGCGKYGDSIQFYRDLYSVDFVTAVKSINAYA